MVIPKHDYEPGSDEEEEEQPSKTDGPDYSDMIRMRAKRPFLKGGQSGLDYRGRVKQTSKKNVQIETKSTLDGKIRVALQTGKRDDNTFICDIGYPFSPLQAFGCALAL